MATLSDLAAIIAALPSSVAAGAGFAEEQFAPYPGFTAYTDGGVVALYAYADGDDEPRVEVYDADGNGDTFFSRDLSGDPVGVAAAWVAHALTVTPPPGYAVKVAADAMNRAEEYRDKMAIAYAAAAKSYDDARTAYYRALARG